MSATFNVSLDEASATSATTATLAGPGGNLIPATVTVKSGSIVEIRPKAGALPGDTRYTWAIGKALKDSTGRSLGVDISRSFSTRSVSWGASTDVVAVLSSFSVGANPAIYTDAAGRTTAAWLAQDGTAVSLFAARLASIDGIWSTPARVATGDSFTAVRLVPGPAGDPVLTWFRNGPGGLGETQWSRFSPASASWSTPEVVSAVPASSTALPVGDAAGNLTLLCHDGTSLRATRRLAATGAWSVAQPIERPYPGGRVYAPLTRAVADSRGNLVVVWMQEDEDGRALYAARFDASSGAWSAAQRVASVPMNGSDAFSLVVDSADVVTLGWTRSGGVAGGDTVWASRLDAAGRAWLTPVRVDRTDLNAPDARGVHVVVDGAGTATAVWQQGGLRMARWAPGAATWTDPTLVLAGGLPPPGVSSMLVDAAGNVVILGTQLGQQVLSARYLLSTGQWQPAELISAPPAGTGLFVTEPVATVDGAGQVVALWFAQNRLASADQYLLAFNRLR